MLDIYDKLAKREKFDDTKVWADPMMKKVFARVPAAGRFADIGCGYGRFTGLLADFNISPERYLGIDPSPGQVALAKKLHPEYEFERGSLYDIGQRHQGAFAGFVCTAVLMHLSRSRMPEALCSLRRSLRLGAVGLISTPIGKGKRPGNITGTTLTLFGQEEMEKFLHNARFGAELQCPDGNMLVGPVWAVS